MSGSKRLAKRSIVGTRVSAVWQQDGRFYPGVIRSLVAEETPATDALYSVVFDDGFEAKVTSKDIVGQGFLAGPSRRLKHGQKVFVTMNGREVGGLVAHQDRRTEEVIIIVKQPAGEEITIHRKVDEVRLMESRKSARLVDQSTDYSKLADLQLTEPKRRAVSHNIDVPASKQHSRHHTDASVSSPREGDVFDDVNMTDDKVAAIALTSLSVSPQSPSQNYAGENSLDITSLDNSRVSSSAASSGFCSGQSERGDTSPPNVLVSGSAPSSFFHDSASLGCEARLGDTSEEKVAEGPKYRCTWRGCSTVRQTTNSIERHIRRAHLDRDSDLELSDNEEEFYYEEIDSDDLDDVTQSFADMYTSSPPAHLPGSFDTVRTFDHDYLKKDDKLSCPPLSMASSVPSAGSHSQPRAATSIPITIPEGQIKRSLSWQIPNASPGLLASPPQRSTKPTVQERLQQHQAQSPKSHMLSMSPHRKPRSEVRKCRKVYGMDHRDQWCTQCKWKKACTRFID